MLFAKNSRFLLSLVVISCPFSSKSLSDYGVISDPTAEENYLRALMIKNAKIKVFLCDSEKFSDTSIYTLTTLDEIDYAIFDEPYDNLKTSCKII